MSDGPAECECVVTTACLKQIADLHESNSKAVFLDGLANGAIAVPACVWDEFCEAFEDEAELLKPYIKTKIRITVVFKAASARLAERRNSILLSGPYERHADLMTAAIALQEELPVLVAKSEKKYFEKQTCTVLEMDEWLDEQG